MKNGRAIQHVVQNNWMFPIFRKDEIRDCITFWNVRTPVVGFATFINADRHIVNMNSGLKVISTSKLQDNIRYLQCRYFPGSFSYPMARPFARLYRKRRWTLSWDQIELHNGVFGILFSSDQAPSYRSCTHIL